MNYQTSGKHSTREKEAVCVCVVLNQKKDLVFLRANETAPRPEIITFLYYTYLRETDSRKRRVVTRMKLIRKDEKYGEISEK